MFTEHWTWGLQHGLFVWRNAAKRGALPCAEVPRLAAALEKLGVEG